MQFKRMWGMELAKTRHQGVFRKPDGRYLVRARVKDPQTDKTVTIHETVEAASPDDALRKLVERKEAVRRAETRAPKSTKRLASFVASEMAERIRDGTIKSAAGRTKWSIIGEHISKDAFVDDYGLKRTLGEILIDRLATGDLLGWRRMVAARVDAWRVKRAGGKPEAEPLCVSTANTWLRQLRTVLRAAHAKELVLADLSGKIALFDESDHDPYPREDPNSLVPVETARFLDEVRNRYPQRYAMVVLGFTLGLRPSSLRPLRWRGRQSDVDWHQGILHVRRSHTEKQEVMNKTKTKTKDEIALTPAMLLLLKWHTVNFSYPGSDLLFPGADGLLLSRSVLQRPFELVAQAIGLTHRITPRGMRRTHKDLMRQAAVDHVVAMAMSMHAGGGSSAPSRMHAHYSTVSIEEKREAAAAVAGLLGLPAASSAADIPIEPPLLPAAPAEDGPAARSAEVRTRPVFELNGRIQTLRQWAADTGIGATTLRYRMLSGMTLEEAIAVGAGRHGKPLHGGEARTGESTGEKTADSATEVQQKD
jgi:integrase